MKRSRAVPAQLIVAVAALVVAGGCQPRRYVDETRRCVDQNGQVLPDEYCTDYDSYHHVYHSGYRYFGYPRWVYGGGGSFWPGGIASGFHSQPTAGARVVTPRGGVVSTPSSGGLGGIFRGGFGGSSKSSGSGVSASHGSSSGGS